MIYTLECDFCGQKSEQGGLPLDAAKEYFVKEGWRLKSSETYQVIGVACPACAQTLK